jgi:hypothetical protein
VGANDEQVVTGKRGITKRNPRPLITAWVITLLFAALIYWIVSAQPVYKEILTPAYALAAVPAAVATWHWFHRRGDHNRRNGDRRHEDRRHGDS